MTMYDFLNQYAEAGILTRVEENIIYVEGIRPDVDLKNLEAELRGRWEEFFKEELILSINSSYIKMVELLRPTNFLDLSVKANLGILTQEEREIIINYYNYVNELKESCEELKQEIMNLNLSQMSEINLPEWVNWNPLPTNPVFIIRARTSDISE